MPRSPLLVVLAAAAILAGCGDDSSTASTAAAASTVSEDAAMKAKEEAAMKAKEEEAAMKAEEAAMKAKGAKLKIVSSRFGKVLADSRGEALYLFDKEKSSKSECYGDCAKAWPPLFTKAKPTAGSGAKRSLLGTTKRRNGKLQVTYAGHPVYYFQGDSPGNILCQGVDEFGGAWLVVKPDGKPVPA